MSTTTHSLQPVGKGALWGGRIASALSVAFMLFDGVTKLLNIAPVREAQTQLGYSENLGPVLGALALVCILLYVIRSTSVLGAVLLTGYLGGAIAAQVRVGAPTFSVVFPVIMGTLAWLGLYLREPTLRAVFPLSRS